MHLFQVSSQACISIYRPHALVSVGGCMIIIMSVSPYPSQEGAMVTVKLLLLGESSVGKTSIVNRYTKGSWEGGSSLLTIGVQVRKIIKQLLGRKVRLELWDTSGQERFRTIPANYFRGIQGVMLVYDITSGESFFRVEDWLTRIDQNTVREKLTLTLVGNKTDLDHHREVQPQHALQFASEHEMKFGQTSAKTGKGVDDIIEHMVVDIMQRGGLQPKNDCIKLALHPEKEEKEEGCC